MKKWLLFSALIWALPARAQTPAVDQKIEYRGDLPKSVARLMPRGAKSLFWGVFSVETDGSNYAIHLFNRRKREPRYNFTRKLGLDLFYKGKNGKLRRINNTAVSYFTDSGDWGPGTQKVDARLLWLDSAHKIPLLKMNVFSRSSADGPVGDESAIIFAKGFTVKPTIQTWGWGTWFSSNSIGVNLDWSQRDRNGFLQVISREFLTDEFHRESILTYQWQGQKFAVVKREKPYTGPPRDETSPDSLNRKTP